MNLGLAIIDAVQRGGLNNWATTSRHEMLSEKNSNRTKLRNITTQENMDKCFNVIKGQMTVSQIAEATGMKHDMTYKYMSRLLDDGLVIRSQKGQPRLYWRV